MNNTITLRGGRDGKDYPAAPLSHTERTLAGDLDGFECPDCAT